MAYCMYARMHPAKPWYIIKRKSVRLLLSSKTFVSMDMCVNMSICHISTPTFTRSFTLYIFCIYICTYKERTFVASLCLAQNVPFDGSRIAFEMDFLRQARYSNVCMPAKMFVAYASMCVCTYISMHVNLCAAHRSTCEWLCVCVYVFMNFHWRMYARSYALIMRSWMWKLRFKLLYMKARRENIDSCARHMREI